MKINICEKNVSSEKRFCYKNQMFIYFKIGCWWWDGEGKNVGIVSNFSVEQVTSSNLLVMLI